MKRIGLAVLAVGASLALVESAGCSAIVGITDLPTVDGGTSSGGTSSGGTSSGGTSSGGTSSGGTDSGSGSGFKGEVFLGTWTITSGTNTVTCPGEAPTASSDTGTITIARGTTSDLVVTTGCMFAFNVTSANTMTLVPGQSCSGTIDDGTQEVVIDPAGTFTVGSTGETAIVAYSGSASDTSLETGASETCSFTESDQYAKQ